MLPKYIALMVLFWDLNPLSVSSTDHKVPQIRVCTRGHRFKCIRGHAGHING